MGAPTPWSRFVMPHAYAPSSTGAPVPGARLYFYGSGTRIPLTTFADSTLSQPNKNPVVADQDGVFPDIFLQSLSYKVVLTDASDAQLDVADPVSPFVPTPQSIQSSLVLEFTCDGNGGVIPAGKFGDQYCPIDCIVQSAVCMADKPGNLVCDVWVAPFVTNTPPNISDSITSSSPITLAASVSSIDTTLIQWSTAIDAGSQVRFNLVSLDTITRFTAQLVCQPAA